MTHLEYVYRADLYCSDCGQQIRARLIAEGFAPANPDDEYSYDSGEFPKGPYSVSEADSPQYCASCGEFLENPLTTDGYDYVREAIAGRELPLSDVLTQWSEFYNLEVR
jgi:hypothetical protein